MDEGGYHVEHGFRIKSGMTRSIGRRRRSRWERSAKGGRWNIEADGRRWDVEAEMEGVVSAVWGLRLSGGERAGNVWGVDGSVAVTAGVFVIR